MAGEVKRSISDRLLAHVVKNETGCWLWNGKAGLYGFVAYKGKTRKAHRVSYEVFKGEIPDNFHVCHHCDEPSCINPDHLFLGTASDNMLDMVEKGRNKTPIDSRQSHFKDGQCPSGERASGAKLTELQAQEIIKRRQAGETPGKLAREFSLHRTTVQRLMRGINWKHLSGSAALKSGEG